MIFIGLLVLALSVLGPKLIEPLLIPSVSGRTLLKQDRALEPVVAANRDPLPLKELARQRGISVGAAVLVDPFREDETYRDLLAQEFNWLTPENAMKFSRLHPERDRYDFTKAAELVDFAIAHQMSVYGHTLVWYRNLPDWLTEVDWSREALMAILKRHIYTVAGRFRGQVSVWDVVNEAIKDGGLRDSIWLKGIGADYIELAFRWAHEADPSALLFYNDYQGEGLGPKSDAIYALVADLKQHHVPIHGVGLQMHIGIDKLPDPQAVAQNMERFAALGLAVRITEMDVKVYKGKGTAAERQAQQAAVYKAMMQVCLAAPNCTGMTTWGVADHYSWVPHFLDHPDSPLLFDSNYQPKPAYGALGEALREIR